VHQLVGRWDEAISRVKDRFLGCNHSSGLLQCPHLRLHLHLLTLSVLAPAPVTASAPEMGNFSNSPADPSKSQKRKFYSENGTPATFSFSRSGLARFRPMQPCHHKIWVSYASCSTYLIISSLDSKDLPNPVTDEAPCRVVCPRLPNRKPIPLDPHTKSRRLQRTYTFVQANFDKHAKWLPAPPDGTISTATAMASASATSSGHTPKVSKSLGFRINPKTLDSVNFDRWSALRWRACTSFRVHRTQDYSLE